ILLLRYLMMEEDDYEDWEDEDRDGERSEVLGSPTEVRRWQDQDGHDWRELSDGSHEWWEESTRSWQP
ncbi:uncharacterized protein METZ01_LOCUS407746, partial [marine metagenome]